MDAESAWKEQEDNNVAKRELQVEKHILRLDKALSEQEELMHILENRLELVVIPREDSAASTTEPEDVLVPLATRLRGFEKQVNRNNRKITDLLDRLQF